MESTNINSSLLKSKQHFEILDGLRGIAAVAIVIFHFMEVVITDPTKNFIGHGYLAVDFFFCLSGFVIAYAYDNRMEKVGLLNFIKLRLIRLHPLIIFGAIIGLIAFLFDPFATYQNLYGLKDTAIIFLATLFLIPLKVMPERFYNVFPLNAPTWSLLWEYVANLAYALFLFRLGKRALTILTIIGAIVLCYVAFDHKSLVGGWSILNFWDGGARILFSFLMGMLIYRFDFVIKNKIGFVGLSVLLFLTFITPFDEKWNWITEPFIIIFIYPLLVALGAGANIKEGLKKICNFSGAISYPLYTTHYSIIWIFANYYNSHKPSFEHISWVIVVGAILCIGFAYLTLVLYDLPFRKYLMEKMKKGAAK